MCLQLNEKAYNHLNVNMVFSFIELDVSKISKVLCLASFILLILITNTTSVALDTNTVVGLEGVDIINRLTEIQVVCFVYACRSIINKSLLT